MTHLLAIDPGKMTGWAWIEYSKTSTKIMETREVPFEDIYTLLTEYLDHEQRVDAVVIEDFRITAGTGKLGSPDWSLRIIGATELLTQRHGIPLTKQMPSSAKTFSTDDKLRAVDLWHRGGAGHANDALRHALLYLVKDGWVDRRLLV